MKYIQIQRPLHEAT